MKNIFSIILWFIHPIVVFTVDSNEEINLNQIAIIVSRNRGFYRPKRSFGQGNVFTGVCHSVNRGEYLTRPPPGPGSSPPGPGRYTPPGPGRYTHPDQAGTPPGTRQVPPLDQVHPPGTRQAGTPPGPGRYTPLGPGRYTHQTRYPPWTRYTPLEAADPRIQSMIGRYASYWNAFLFKYENDLEIVTSDINFNSVGP